jgi:hypothetical protein
MNENTYECKNFYHAKENEIILSKPNKTLLYSENIELDKIKHITYPYILDISTTLSLTVENPKIPIQYTVIIEKNSNEIEICEYYSHKSYISEQINIKSIDKQKNDIFFNKNDTPIIKIYGSSIDGKNKVITTPKLLNLIIYS